MAIRVFFGIVLLFCSVHLWGQVEPSASGGSVPTDDDSLMSLPPQDSGSFYPSSVGSESRLNTLSGGVIVTAAYDDNVLAGETGHPVGAESYTVLPNIQLTERTSRISGSLSYSPGFTFYDPTTELNRVNQNAVGSFDYRMSPRLRFGASETFEQNSTVFSQPYTLSGATVSGSAESGPPIIVAPYAGQIVDSTQAHAGYQFSRTSMISGSVYFSSFNFSNLAQNEGLYNSNSGGAAVSYSRRLTRSQYFGINYRYSISETNPVPSTTESHFASLFYSVNFERAFSLSLTGGPEYTISSAPGVATTHTWAPSGVASIGWQKSRANFALSFSRSVTTGWGLLGNYTADTASASVRWRFTQKLFGTVSANYADTTNATPAIAPTTQSGHLLFGRASLSYALGEHLIAVAEYARIHENYSGISEISNDPNDDRVSVSLNYRFTRPLGQ